MGLVSWLGRRGQSPAPRSRQTHQPQEPSRAWEVARSAGGFMLGIALASLYGALVLLAQGHNIWYCLITTIGLGAVLGLGMAFSAKARVTVLLSLPQIFTKEGKMLMLLLALTMAVQGPCANILHNFSRAAESLSCGAELALNQTAERLQRAQEPLINLLSKIKEIAQEAKAVGDRVRKFFRSIMDAVSHVARALRNVWLWLANIGQVCNEELGSPFHRCLRLFDEAKDNCEHAIPFLFFLCYIITAFKPLCGLANIALLFCIIPQYIQNFIKTNIAAPLNNALDRVRREFEFNISAVHHFDISFNASKSLGEVALDIMEGVSQSLEPTRRVLGLFLNVSFLAILYMYFKALRYRHRYLRDETFDNIYITRRFRELDQLRAEQGKPTVLPLTARECGRYISPAGLWLSRQEHRRYGLQLVGFLRHMLLGFCIILADYSLFWLLDLIRHQLRGEIVARAPAVVGVSVNGSGYTSEIYRDMVSAFGVLQQGNVSVVSQRCLIQPVEPDYTTYVFMGILYGICLFISVFGNYVARLRRLVCATYYPSREQERTAFLHSTILAQGQGWHEPCSKPPRCARPTPGKATCSSSSPPGKPPRGMHPWAWSHPGHTSTLLGTAEGQCQPRQGQSRQQRLSACRVPCFARLARLFGIQQKRCLACGVTKQPDFITCITNGCKGLYCRDCHQTLNNICTICMGPLTYPDTGDKEIDSSDEETVGLWLGAVRARRGQEQGRLLRQRIGELEKGLGGCRRLPPHLAARLRAQLKEEASGESDGGSSGVESESSSVSSLDFGYQERRESSGSELEQVVALRPPRSRDRAR
ncbi:LOW QUALITY PROTEIN: DC-STAMP domain-containing protein 2 [Strigops habroptila]|uniref:LOW QUALITY PROTEIN: DC-STAMP domain-containing protein 2 n=1 Tax=Strigops habroptila TaxID=2489341 RepID=UPI0011CF31C4|nr:LOW QUALITY PROTEIN: DC-STAMP domain-containing protein 2 [Strigops habroptila]